VFSCVCMDHYIFLNTKMYNIAIQMSLCYEFVCVVRGPNPFPRHRHKNDPSPHTTFAKEQRGNLFHLFLSLCFWKKFQCHISHAQMLSPYLTLDWGGSPAWTVLGSGIPFSKMLQNNTATRRLWGVTLRFNTGKKVHPPPFQMSLR
jgi:hypothetical protein